MCMNSDVSALCLEYLWDKNGARNAGLREATTAPARARSCRSPKRALSNKNNTAFRDALFVLVIIMATSFLVISANKWRLFTSYE